MRSLGLEKLLAIKMPCTNGEYRNAFNSLNFSVLSKIYTFQKKISIFVKDNEETLNKFESIIARLIIFYKFLIF